MEMQMSILTGSLAGLITVRRCGVAAIGQCQ